MDATLWDYFLAHASPDKEYARRLHELLRAEGLRPFLDDIDLEPGDVWDIELPKALRASAATIVLISPNTANAHFERDEIQRAISLSRQLGARHRIIPLYVGGMCSGDNVPYGLSLFQGLTLGDDWTLGQAAARLAKIARGRALEV